MNIKTKRQLTRYLLIAQISIYVFIVLHAILWYVFDVHVLTKLCPFVFGLHVGNLEVNLAVFFWILVFGSVLFLGRAFCAWGCMFGAYQDFVFRLVRKLKLKPRQSKWAKRLLSGIVAFLIVAIIFSNQTFWPSFYWFTAMIVFIGLLLWLFIEKKTSSPTLLTLPKYIYFAQFLGGIIALWMTLDVFHKGFSWASDKYEVFYEMQWGLALLAGLVAFGIMLGEKRMFCKFLCPIGLTLRFINAIPFPVKYKVRKTSAPCSQCGRCNKECFMGLNPMQEITQYDEIQDPNCINCLVCVAKCPKDALDFKRK